MRRLVFPSSEGGLAVCQERFDSVYKVSLHICNSVQFSEAVIIAG